MSDREGVHRCSACNQKKGQWLQLKDGRWVCYDCAARIGKDAWVGSQAHECPGCGAKLDGATNVDDGGEPKPGDVTVCMYCSMGLIFETDKLRRLTLAEESRLPREMRRNLMRARWAVNKMRSMS
jgi:hypothetical protein